MLAGIGVLIVASHLHVIDQLHFIDHACLVAVDDYARSEKLTS